MAEAGSTKVIAELTFNEQAIGFTAEDIRLLLAQVTPEQLMEVLPDQPDLLLLAVRNVPVTAEGAEFMAPLVVLAGAGLSAELRARAFSALAEPFLVSEHEGPLPGSTLLIGREK
jgi:hypothetical protein